MKDWVIRDGVWYLEEPTTNVGTSCSTANFGFSSGEEIRFKILIGRLDRIIELLEEGEK